MGNWKRNGKRHKFLLNNQQPDDGCVFYLGWNGYCEDARVNRKKYCADHVTMECWHDGCGKQARKSCAIQECDIVECYYHKHYEEGHE